MSEGGICLMDKQGIFDNIAESLARSYDIIYYINAEINYKRTEFGLPLAGEGKED